MTREKRIELAVTAAAEYRRLCETGRYPEADQARRTVDDLVGAWQWTGLRYVWSLPRGVARLMA